MPSTTHVRFLDWDQFIAQHLDDWMHLWQASGAAPDLSPMWAQGLLHGHGLDTRELRVALAWRGEELALVWPLFFQSQRRLGMTWKKVSALTNIFCMHGGLLTSLDLGQAVRLTLRALREDRWAWSWIDVDLIEVGSPLHTAWLNAAGQLDCDVEHIPKARSPYIVSPGMLDDFLATKTRNFRSNMRARRRDALTDPRIEIRHFTRADEVPAYMTLALQIERQCWKAREGCALASRDWEARLYEDLLQRFAGHGMTRAAVLFIDGVPAAHSMDLRHGDRVYGLKTSFDPTFGAMRPGVMLLVARLERYFADGVHEFDFLGADEEYKLQWTRRCRAHESLRLYAPTLAARTLFAGTQLRTTWRTAPTPATVPLRPVSARSRHAALGAMDPDGAETVIG
jgi:CelD/BcsL family acetyltransferase involved in cellulose biosynthesis